MCVYISVFRGFCCVDAYDTDDTDTGFGLSNERLKPSLTSFFWSVECFQLPAQSSRFVLQPCQSKPDTKGGGEDFNMSQYLHVLAHSQPEQEDKSFT